MSAFLKIEDTDGNVYNFDRSFWITGDDIETAKTVLNQFYAAGGRQVSDGFITARSISITGSIYADSLAEYETAYNNFLIAVLKGGKLSKSVDGATRYIDVSDPDISTSQEQGQQARFSVSVTFLAEFPFWKDSTETVDTNVLSGDGSFTVDGSGSIFLMQPTIQIDADQGNDVPLVKLTNTNDGGASFTYSDTNFLAGDTLIINSEEGTVQKNNNNAISNLTTARFLRLQNIVNNFSYEGAACTIKVKYRKLYL
jgi:hypothetical protein